MWSSASPEAAIAGSSIGLRSPIRPCGRTVERGGPDDEDRRLRHGCACHEGNYGLANILAGARAEERSETVESVDVLRRRRICRSFILVLLLLGLASFLSRGLNPDTEPARSVFLRRHGRRAVRRFEEARFRLVLRDLDAHDLTTVISVGDIFWRPCNDVMYQRARDRFNGLRHPVIYTPGDNEWFDCWEAGSGGYEPQERLARLRQIFYTTPAQSLGGRRIALGQSAGLHRERAVDGSFARLRHCASHRQRNGRWPFPNRTEDDVAASKTENRSRGSVAARDLQRRDGRHAQPSSSQCRARSSTKSRRIASPSSPF